MSEIILYLSYAWGAFVYAFSNQAFSNVFSALLGALFGSLSGYWFNRKLEKSRTNERYLIQRKNTIYSPIYKKLLALRRYLEDIEGQENKSINIRLTEGRYMYRNGIDFQIWNDINQDIRKVYISSKQRELMDILTTCIETHMLLENKVDEKIGIIRHDFTGKNIGKLKNKDIDPHYRQDAGFAITSSLKWLIFPEGRGVTEESTKADLIKALLGAYDIDEDTAKNEVKSLITRIGRKKTLSEINTSFKELLTATDNAIAVFESTISSIVNQYEGGV